MTDFYSVLKTSITRRGLRSAADRLEVYDQAREAMIRKLWSFDPPLSEDEIDTRIGLFDAAVEKIESDLERAFANTGLAQPKPRRETNLPQAPEPSQRSAVYDGYDEEADYVPAVAVRSAERQRKAPPPAPAYRAVPRDEPPARRESAKRLAPPRPRDGDGFQYGEEALPTYRRPVQADEQWVVPASYHASRPGLNGSVERDEGAYPEAPPADAPGDRRSVYREKTAPEPAYRVPARRANSSREAEFRDPNPTNRLHGQPTTREQPTYADVSVYREEPAYREEHAYTEELADREEPAYTEEPVYTEEPTYREETAYGEEQAEEIISPSAYREPEYEDPDYEVPNDPRLVPSDARRSAPRRSRDRWDASSAEAVDDEYSPRGRNTDFEQANDNQSARKARRAGKSRKAGKPRKTASASGRGKRNPVRLLTIAIIGLAAILIAFNVYVLLPVFFGSQSSRPVPLESPQKVDDRLPVSGVPATSATRIVSDSTTASEIPDRSLDVAETLVVFDGRDPTVFEGSSNNPIQFDSDSEGGFARISSATSAAGARAAIGPGLADRLAGQTVRVTLLARSSAENGAATLRFAYQSGLAVSHWQSADLSPSYSSYGMIWRVPATHTAAGDYLLIEPGIPGDGTGTDIRSIRIDVLTS